MSKTTWRYGVTLVRADVPDLFEIREIYTSPDGSLSWCAEPAVPQGDTWLELFDDLAMMERAAHSKDVLDITDPARPVWTVRSLRSADPVGGSSDAPR